MSEDWKTYRTRFVVRAKQLTQPITLTDINGREQHGTVGDYLVESSDGLRIARREVFEDVYVAMEAAENVAHTHGHCEETSGTEKHKFNRDELERPAKICTLAPLRPSSEHVDSGVPVN